MAKLEMKCTQGYKNKVLDHISFMGGRYRNQAHFVQEAIESKMQSDILEKAPQESQ